MIFLLLIMAGAASRSESEDLRVRGQSLYSSLCQRCHGETGDDTSYSGITPLSGITSRIPSQEIPRLSAPFVGRIFQGREAAALIAHLATLKGEKGFEKPGYLFSPYLLEKKHGDRHDYRIVDTRPADEYRAGHIPNAVSWRPAQSALDTVNQLGNLGAGPDTFVVVYDSNSGPQAAAAWWAIHSAGHERAAVLDGGFAAWKSQGYPVGTATTEFEPTRYPETTGVPTALPESCEQLPERPLLLGADTNTRGPQFDWRKTQGENGLLPAPDIHSYLESMGIVASRRYAPQGSPEEKAYLVFLLRLLGVETQVSPTLDHVCLPPG